MATHHLAEQAVDWIRHARDVFGEFIIFLDENRLTPGTLERAESVANRVYRRRADKWYDLDFGSMASACESEWVFALDHDEELSTEWTRDALQEILGTTDFTHFWLPRGWIVPGGQHIHAAPWWPDFQLRLLRNDISKTAFPARLHDVIKVPGAGACLPGLMIHHHVLWLFSREEREAKVRYYEQLRPEGDLRHYYLFEDYNPPTAPLPGPHQFGDTTAVGKMEKLSAEDVCRIFLEIHSPVDAAAPATLLLLPATLRNQSRHRAASFPPHPIRIAYHWLDAATRDVVVFEGERSALFPAVDAGGNAPVLVSVFTPTQPGQYVLQVTLVQENVCWFEEIRPDTIQEFQVTIS